MKIIPINGRWFVKLDEKHEPSGDGYSSAALAAQAVREILELRHLEQWAREGVSCDTANHQPHEGHG